MQSSSVSMVRPVAKKKAKNRLVFRSVQISGSPICLYTRCKPGAGALKQARQTPAQQFLGRRRSRHLLIANAKEHVQREALPRREAGVLVDVITEAVLRPGRALVDPAEWLVVGGDGREGEQGQPRLLQPDEHMVPGGRAHLTPRIYHNALVDLVQGAVPAAVHANAGLNGAC